MLQGFKQFILRGNVLDLAVAVVMGVAFGAVVTALVKDLITPLIAAIVGKPDFSAIEFTVNGSKFPIGDFINALVSFILIAAAVYFFIVLPMNTILRLEFGAEKSLPTRPPKNARNVSVMCRLRLAVAPSALPSSREARPAEHADSSVSALNDQLCGSPGRNQSPAGPLTLLKPTPERKSRRRSFRSRKAGCEWLRHRSGGDRTGQTPEHRYYRYPMHSGSS